MSNPSKRPSAIAQLQKVAEDAGVGNNGPTSAPSNTSVPQSSEAAKKKKKKRSNKKRKDRRQSFAAPTDETDNTEMEGERPSLLDSQDIGSANRDSFYRLGAGRNQSNTSLESEALLDHR